MVMMKNIGNPLAGIIVSPHCHRLDSLLSLPQTRSTDGSERREWHGIGYQFPLSQLTATEDTEI